jgi:hypothetical protein
MRHLARISEPPIEATRREVPQLASIIRFACLESAPSAKSAVKWFGLVDMRTARV